MELILPDKKRSVAEDLRRALGQKVKDDFPTRTAYAVDASIYKIRSKVLLSIISKALGANVNRWTTASPTSSR